MTKMDKLEAIRRICMTAKADEQKRGNTDYYRGIIDALCAVIYMEASDEQVS